MSILSFDPAIKNLAYSIVTKNNNYLDVHDFNLIDILDNERIKNFSFNEIMSKLLVKLDEIDLRYYNITHVLIENMPSFKNPLIKSISMVIYSFYKIKKYDVYFCSPSKKIKSKTCTYRERKKKSIEYCLKLLNEESKRKLNNFKKKDDITDSILQAYHFDGKL